MGRPSDYSEELAETICARLAEGESLRAICRDDDMPHVRTVFRWLANDDAFATKYARAREAQADALFDDMLEIADDGRNDWMEKRSPEGESIGWRENGEAIRRSDLRIKTRQWMASKLQPKKYGDKLALTGADGGAIEHTIAAKDLTDDELARIALGGGAGTAAETEGA